MAKLILNPAYRIRRGNPKCSHKKTVIKLGEMVYEFCDECSIVWIRREG